MEGAVRTSFSLKTTHAPLANVIVRVGSAWMGHSGGGAEIEEGMDGRWGLTCMSEDECAVVGTGADLDS
jgi:hypothetical protein